MCTAEVRQRCLPVGKHDDAMAGEKYGSSTSFGALEELIGRASVIILSYLKKIEHNEILK